MLAGVVSIQRTMYHFCFITYLYVVVASDATIIPTTTITTIISTATTTTITTITTPTEPEVTPPENLEPLKWKNPDIDGLVQFLVHEKSFSEDRVRKAADRLLQSKDKASQRT